MDFSAFSIARLPRIEFGAGVIKRLPELARAYGQRALLVTGGTSFQQTPYWAALKADLASAGLSWAHCTIDGEPSPERVDELVTEHADQGVDVVIGIGGGSALDAAKAIAGLLRVGRSVMDYLEGVGPELAYEGPAVPLLAVPTTAGTGSEATKNAVLSRHGLEGFKKSFRDDQLVAEYAILDPDLLASCPPDLIAANGMDALTQLLESYVSSRSNPFTDALALSGLTAARDALLPWYKGEGDLSEARSKMAYAALLSGITLAQCGLGSVHGLASPLGAFYPIPHGLVCGTLVAEATAVNIAAMQEREPDNPALAKYAQLGELLCLDQNSSHQFATTEAAQQGLVELLHDWTGQMNLPGLGQYGLEEGGLDHVVAHSRGSSMKTNPIVLTDAELRALLLTRL